MSFGGDFSASFDPRVPNLSGVATQYLDGSGSFTAPPVAAGGATLTPATSTRNTIQPASAAVVPLVIKGFASQSANLFNATDSADALVASMKSSGWLGIGASAPTTEMEVFQATGALRGITSSLYGATSGAAFISFKRGRGTATVPTTLANADYVGLLRAYAHDGTNFVKSAHAGFVVDGVVSAGAVPTKFVVYTGSADFPGGQEPFQISSANVMSHSGTFTLQGHSAFGSNLPGGTQPEATISVSEFVTPGQTVSGNPVDAGCIFVTALANATWVSRGLYSAVFEANFTAPLNTDIAPYVGGFSSTSYMQSPGTMTRGMGMQSILYHQSAGTITRGSGIETQLLGNSTGGFTTGIGINILKPSLSGGAVITTLYGLKIEDQDNGTTNYALYTGAGAVRFGDAVTNAISTTLSDLTASRAVFSDSNKRLVSNAISGTGNVAMTDSPVFTTSLTATAVTLSDLTASVAVFTDGSKKLISKSVSGTGNVALVDSPTFTTLLTAAAVRLATIQNAAGTGAIITTQAGGATLIQAGASNQKVLKVYEAVSQSVNTQEWTDSGGVAYLAIAPLGHLTFSSGVNIITNATTGTKIGTGATQKLGFWNATPIAQPTTAIAASTFVANTSLTANDSATWDGYTIGQVVKALRNFGVLA